MRRSVFESGKGFPGGLPSAGRARVGSQLGGVRLYLPLVLRAYRIDESKGFGRERERERERESSNDSRTVRLLFSRSLFPIFLEIGYICWKRDQDTLSQNPHFNLSKIPSGGGGGFSGTGLRRRRRLFQDLAPRDEALARGRQSLARHTKRRPNSLQVYISSCYSFLTRFDRLLSRFIELYRFESV